jgi:peptidoglycan LD-endopeptidase CwlK
MLDERSFKNLVGVDERLVSVVKLATSNLPFDTYCTEGVRTLGRQQQLYAQGRTALGRIVTWTMKSKHLEGKAVDLVPFVDGKILWDDLLLFAALGHEMLEAAKELGVKIRWGWDWDMDGVLQEKGETDGPHFELM